MPELFSLLILACPVVMGAMMWLMMRSSKRGSATSAATPEPLRSDAQLVAMRAELDQLHAELRRRRDASAYVTDRQ